MAKMDETGKIRGLGEQLLTPSSGRQSKNHVLRRKTLK